MQSRLPSRVGDTQSNISNPLATAKEISPKSQFPLNILVYLLVKISGRN